MIKLKQIIRDYSGPNPFSDSNVRSYSSKKLLSEFCPTSIFWSMFNDQHEVLLGTRGSGKSYLLKMMRYSLLLDVNEPKAQKIVEEQNFLSLYVPMHLEYITHFLKNTTSEEEHSSLFSFGFNCLLAISLIDEIQSVLNHLYTDYEKAKITMDVVKYLNRIWFTSTTDLVYDLISLKSKVSKMYYETDLTDLDKNEDTKMFCKQICTPLVVVKEFISKIFGFHAEPTWIICIDEAEFLSETAMKCINNVFRSDSNRIIIKVATMHYKHKTLETLAEGISVSPGNDFVYRVIDLDCNSHDFVRLSDSLCANRLNDRLCLDNKFEKLEDFVETIFFTDDNEYKHEHLIDYFIEEFGDEASEHEVLKEKIISNLNPKTQKLARKSTNFRKSYYDKLLPVYIVRCMYNKSTDGNSVPGWYSGASMVRKLSQGNPRMYLELLNKLYETSKINSLKFKAQHRVLLKFSEDNISSIEALPEVGPIIFENLNEISKRLNYLVHDNYLRNVGAAFLLDFKTDEEFCDAKKWLEVAIGFSKLIVDGDALVNGLKPTTRYMLSNTYAAYNWLPMRVGNAPKINLKKNIKKTYPERSDNVNHQLSLFD